MTQPPSTDSTIEYQRSAALRAVEWVESGMIVGLGTGRTASFAVRRIAERLREGSLTGVVGVPTSAATEAEARAVGIPVMDPLIPRQVDLTIDGADEVDGASNLIKGAGGALFREKIVAQMSKREIIVVDDSKLVGTLGEKGPVPVEVVQFGWRSQVPFLEALGARVVVRQGAGTEPFLTDQGNLILDCRFGRIADAPRLARELESRAGVVAHGLFLGLATDVVIAGRAGVVHRTRS
jgi:ribose 5-phosphate isomerase A